MAAEQRDRESIFSLEGVDLLDFLGHHDANLRRLEDAFPGELVLRGDQLRLRGPATDVERMGGVIHELLRWARDGHVLDRRALDRMLESAALPRTHSSTHRAAGEIPAWARGRKGSIEARTAGQAVYLEAMSRHDIVFAFGPAGTGKTFLAVVRAVQALQSNEVEKILLVRPAVEAGEQLGFLPGDLQEKIDPYLRPLYDSLHDLLGATKLARLMTAGTIEVAPLAYMRGRTLNHAFVILDEAQNATLPQMKMFLTRIGEGTRAIITGDPSQVDLPEASSSGLRRIRPILEGVEGLAFVELLESDVVRHPLVRKIVSRFDAVEKGSGR